MPFDPASIALHARAFALAISSVLVFSVVGEAQEGSGRPGSEGPTPQPRPTTGDVALDSFVESLIPRMADASPRVRAAVRAALLDVGPDSIPILKSAMASTADTSLKRAIGEVVRRYETGGAAATAAAPGKGGKGGKAAGGGGKGAKAGGKRGGKGGGKGAGGGDSTGMTRSPLLAADRVIEVVEATADQKPKISQAFDQFEQSRREAAEEMRRIGDPAIMTERLLEIREDLDLRLKIILNPEQFLKFRSQFAPPGQRRGSDDSEDDGAGG